MDTMKYLNVSQSTSMAVNNNAPADEVDSLFISSCWSSNSGMQAEFMDNFGSDKLLLESTFHDDAKSNMDTLHNLLGSTESADNELAELKPLPPFTGYTANLSINGIQGHHYHTISQRNLDKNNGYSSFNEQNMVTSSTCNMNADSVSEQEDETFFSTNDSYRDCVDPDSVSSLNYETCSQSTGETAANIKSEVVEYDIDDIAAIIGSAIADTTVPNPDSEDPTGSRESWMDLDAWIDSTCAIQQKGGLIMSPDGLTEYIVPPVQSSSMQSQEIDTLSASGYMPLLKNRLQNGPPIKQEMLHTTNYGNDAISTSSPPSNVVSTTDNIFVTVNGRFLPQYINNLENRIPSPDLINSTPTTTKKSRNKAQKKQIHANLYQTDQTLGVMGKEKPVHRCNICNRGFLNKSNIKVHVRLHTGEKPFRCETCSKAFRQKAHLLKHQQIHKRIGRE